MKTTVFIHFIHMHFLDIHKRELSIFASNQISYVVSFYNRANQKAFGT